MEEQPSTNNLTTQYGQLMFQLRVAEAHVRAIQEQLRPIEAELVRQHNEAKAMNGGAA